MKLVDRKTLLQMPKGTVFAKQSHVSCYTHPIYVLQEVVGEQYFAIDITSFHVGKAHFDTTSAYLMLEQKPGINIDMRLCKATEWIRMDDDKYYNIVQERSAANHQRTERSLEGSVSITLDQKFKNH